MTTAAAAATSRRHVDTSRPSFAGLRTLDDIDAETGENTKLYGIPKRGAVGCLTLYEHYGYVECGRNLKVHSGFVVLVEGGGSGRWRESVAPHPPAPAHHSHADAANDAADDHCDWRRVVQLVVQGSSVELTNPLRCLCRPSTRHPPSPLPSGTAATHLGRLQRKSLLVLLRAHQRMPFRQCVRSHWSTSALLCRLGVIGWRWFYSLSLPCSLVVCLR
jgi:hypothetical protein